MNPATEFNDRFQKELEAEQFPMETVSPFWKDSALYALKYASLLSLGIDPNQFEKLLSFERDGLNLYQFAILSNNLQARTPMELSMKLTDYCTVMRDADDLVKLWNEKTSTIREKLAEAIAEESKMKAAAVGDQVKKRSGMGVVKGEA